VNEAMWVVATQRVPELIAALRKVLPDETV